MTGTIAKAAHEAGIRAGVGAPIIVDGRVWGTVSAGATDRVPLPPDIERRLTQFTELVATAISNTQARQELRRLVDEQTALRRIATLVAEGAESQVDFRRGVRGDRSTVRCDHRQSGQFHTGRFQPGDRRVEPARRSRPDRDRAPARRRDDQRHRAAHSGAPAVATATSRLSGELAALIRRLGIRSEVGAPVVVDGGVWGALIAGTDESEPLPAGTEHGLAGFAELIATAVSNATARSELVASRARIVTAADEQRRRVVRDLHDGAQQRLVHAVITLQLAHGLDDAPPELGQLVDEALEHTGAAIEELRELAHGIHPALLTSRGLAAAVEALADRAPVPVHVDIPDRRYPAAVESAAYFVAAEALTNVAKYANASTARVTASQVGRLGRPRCRGRWRRRRRSRRRQRALWPA